MVRSLRVRPWALLSYAVGVSGILDAAAWLLRRPVSDKCVPLAINVVHWRRLCAASGFLPEAYVGNIVHVADIRQLRHFLLNSIRDGFDLI